jgi:hypothetical protein
MCSIYENKKYSCCALTRRDWYRSSSFSCKLVCRQVDPVRSRSVDVFDPM